MKKEQTENRIHTGYVHAKKGWPVVISQGIGDRWSVYLVKPNGSLQRCKQFVEYRFLDSVRSALYEYNGKAFKVNDD